MQCLKKAVRSCGFSVVKSTETSDPEVDESVLIYGFLRYAVR